MLYKCNLYFHIKKSFWSNSLESNYSFFIRISYFHFITFVHYFMGNNLVLLIQCSFSLNFWNVDSGFSSQTISIISNVLLVVRNFLLVVRNVLLAVRNIILIISSFIQSSITRSGCQVIDIWFKKLFAKNPLEYWLQCYSRCFLE